MSLKNYLKTPWPWHQYPKTVFAGNDRGYDVTAYGNYEVIASDLTEHNSKVVALIPEMIELLLESRTKVDNAWESRRDKLLHLIEVKEN